MGSFQGGPGPEGQAGEGEPGSHAGGLGSQPTHGDREGVSFSVWARAPMLRLDREKDFLLRKWGASQVKMSPRLGSGDSASYLEERG